MMIQQKLERLIKMFKDVSIDDGIEVIVGDVAHECSV